MNSYIYLIHCVTILLVSQLLYLVHCTIIVNIRISCSDAEFSVAFSNCDTTGWWVLHRHGWNGHAGGWTDCRICSGRNIIRVSKWSDACNEGGAECPAGPSETPDIGGRECVTALFLLVESGIICSPHWWGPATKAHSRLRPAACTHSQSW